MLALGALLSGASAYAGNPKVDKPVVTKYSAELSGDGNKQFIEVENRTAGDPLWLIRLKEKKNSKEPLDTLTIYGKVSKIEFKDFNLDRQQRIIIYFDSQDNMRNIVIYQLRNNRLDKIFSAASAFGIEGNFSSFARIRIGKFVQRDNTPNLVPDWETWVWAKDKFIKE